MWSEGHWASEQGLTDMAHDSQKSRHALVTPWKQDWLSCCFQSCSLTHWLCFSYISFFLTIIGFVSYFHSHSRSPLNLLTATPLSGCPGPVDREHPANEIWKKYLLFLSTEGKLTISSFSPLLQFNIMAKPSGYICIPALHAEQIKILPSYTARLEQIRTIRLAPCHQFWLYTPFHNQEAFRGC